MIERISRKQIEKQLSQFPAVAIVGSRQVGKTTLARSLDGQYFDLEKEEDQLRLELEWSRLVKGDQLIILDEAQTLPEVFPRLRSAIDEDRKRKGRFLILGSVSPALMMKVGESLAGRLAVCELSPFLIHEVDDKLFDKHWKSGGYPDGGIIDSSNFPDWQINYLNLLSQRDFVEWGLPAKPSTTQRLFRMLSAVNGQILNLSQLGKSMGLSYHTINGYIEFLENVYLIRRLPAYSINLKKRLIKSPKIYWRDTGLLHALLGVTGEDDLLNFPWVGYSWEGWVIEQILSHLNSRGKQFQAFFLRTSDHYEIDLVLEYARKRWALEIKLTSMPNAKDLNKLRKISEMINVDYSILVSRTQNPIYGENEGSMSLPLCIRYLLDQ